MQFDKSIEIIRGGIDPLFSNLDLLNEFDSIYLAIFGERIKLCCGKTLQYYFDKLKKHVEMKNQDKKYLLKEGVQMHCNHNVYTNANLTDEVAIELLKQDPRRISNFEKFPENWNEKPKAKTPTAKK